MIAQFCSRGATSNHSRPYVTHAQSNSVVKPPWKMLPDALANYNVSGASVLHICDLLIHLHKWVLGLHTCMCAVCVAYVSRVATMSVFAIPYSNNFTKISTEYPYKEFQAWRPEHSIFWNYVNTIEIRLVSNYQLNAQFLYSITIYIYVRLKFSTCFEKYYAHFQEDKLYYYSIW